MLFLLKKRLGVVSLIVLIILPTFICAALEFNTRDTELDLTLKELNVEAEADIAGYKADLT
jgi:hypothetical protein